MNKIYKQDRELSNAERAVIVGFYRSTHNVQWVAGVMEISTWSVELILNRYFAGKLVE